MNYRHDSFSLRSRKRVYKNGHAGQFRQGFTLIEIIIVVAVIAILATITVVSYNGVITSSRNKEVSAESVVVAGELKKIRADEGSFPDDLSSIQTKSNFTYDYSRLGNNEFCVAVSRYDLTFRVVSGDVTAAVSGDCSGILANGDACPTGYIVVPGNTILGTSTFCVMKYEAKNVGGVATSVAAGTPWVYISQEDAKVASQAACDGCHLITEAEWMTIAANILSVPSNWSGGSIGNGAIYQGHIYNNPAGAIEASTDDNDGMYGMTGGFGGVGFNSRRTLTLSNGEVIWDLSGNVWEVTDAAQVVYGFGMPSDATYVWREWPTSGMSFGSLPQGSRPSALAVLPGLSDAGSWGGANAIGTTQAYYWDTAVRAFVRGGAWSNSGAGILALRMNSSPTDNGNFFGFRVAK